MLDLSIFRRQRGDGELAALVGDVDAASRLCWRIMDLVVERGEQRTAVVAGALIAALLELNADRQSLLNLLTIARARVKTGRAWDEEVQP